MLYLDRIALGRIPFDRLVSSSRVHLARPSSPPIKSPLTPLLESRFAPRSISSSDKVVSHQIYWWDFVLVVYLSSTSTIDGDLTGGGDTTFIRSRS